MDKVLTCPIHVIATARGKDTWVLEDKNGKQVPTKVGMGQQQDKDISYEYTVSFMIAQDTHIASVDKDNTRLFDGKYEVLTERDGKALYDWANQGDAPAPKPVKKPEPVTDPVDGLKDIIKEIKTETESLLGMGVEKSVMADTIKGICGTANYNKIDNIDIANQVLDALKALEGGNE